MGYQPLSRRELRIYAAEVGKYRQLEHYAARQLRRCLNAR